jgi:hypothetical protein
VYEHTCVQLMRVTTSTNAMWQGIFTSVLPAEQL